MQELSLVIINYNGAGILPAALHAARSSRCAFAEVLVIDNGSEDGSEQAVADFEEVTFIALRRNLGPAAARNIGFRLARCDRILFQDNDILLSPDTAFLLDASLQAAGERALLCAPRVCYRDRPEIIQYDSAHCHVLGMMSLRHPNQPAHQHPGSLQRCTSLVTACFLIDRSRWQEARGQERLFDETLIFNFEDHDFGVRANLLGFNLYCNSEAVVLHGCGTPGQSWRPGDRIPAQRIFCLTRNRWWIVLRYFAWFSLLRLLPFFVVLEILQVAALVKKGFFTSWAAALVSTLRHLPRLLQQRRHWQSCRRRSDSDILIAGPLPLTDAMRPGRAAGSLLDLFHRALRWTCRKQRFPESDWRENA